MLGAPIPKTNPVKQEELHAELYIFRNGVIIPSISPCNTSYALASLWLHICVGAVHRLLSLILTQEETKCANKLEVDVDLADEHYQRGTDHEKGVHYSTDIS
jgi:hypothetical protein